MMHCQVRGMGWVTPPGYGQGSGDAAFAMGPGALPKLEQRLLFGESFPRFGRLDAYSRAGLAAIALALKDANLDVWTEKRPVGVVASTETGCLETDLQYFQTVLTDAGRFASPNLFAYTLPNCMLGEAAIRFGLTGPAFVVQERSNDFLSGLKAGLGTLALGLCATVVAGVCNAPPPPLDLPFRSFPGAFFAVIERDPAGPLTLREDTLMWDETPVLSLESLVNTVRQARQSA